MTTQQMNVIRKVCTAGAVVGLVTTVTLAIKATPKAMQQLEYRKMELAEVKKHPVEAGKATWKCYIPTMISGIATVTCIMGAHHMSNKMYANAFAMYKLSETALKEFKDAAVEVVGDEKVEEIRDRVSEKKMDQTVLPENIRYLSGENGGGDLFYDGLSGRFFMSDLEKVRRVVNDFNHAMITHSYTQSLNDFYDLLDLPYIELGTRIGWSANHLLEMHYTTMLKDNKPCIVMEPEDVYNLSEL